MKKILFTLVAVISFTMASAQTWIWYPGDYEVWLGNQMNNRRTERGAFFPPFWKSDSHYVVVEFSKKVNLDKPEVIAIAAEGRYNVKIDGKLQFGMPQKITLPKGEHTLCIKVHNQATPPAVFVKGETINSDASWKVTYEDKEWIDESGKASDTSATMYMDASCWNFNSESEKPSEFSLAVEDMSYRSKKSVNTGTLYDFGKETIGFINLKGIQGNGTVHIYYGESPEEAMDTEKCETLDKLLVGPGSLTDLATNHRSDRNGSYLFRNSKAFRYAFVTKDNGVSFDDLNMKYEYLPVQYQGWFKCNDKQINEIWDVSAYTMHLTTREFFIDGIKRDRWVWSGDAIQSYLMNYYLFFDSESVKRTIWLLRGKDPVTSHINTIMDYTFYWFLSVYDYYMHTGDDHFVKQLYPRMESLMEFVLGRTNQNGMVEGLTGDWVFIDWAEGPMDKKGEVAFQQVLFCKSLETMAMCADIVGEQQDQMKYAQLAAILKGKIEPTFWNKEKKALVHNFINGKQSEQVTRYANMFAIFFDYLDDAKKQEVKNSVLKNDEVMSITTPYMRFYELEAMCALGDQKTVLQEMKAYWGGMLEEGATSFWEKYNPSESGTEHLAMYGRPYGKSLCHAWGASPVYLLGKYYLGVKPTKPDYAEFVVEPSLGGLKWISGGVPTNHGVINVYMDQHTIKVKAPKGKCKLLFRSKKNPVASDGNIRLSQAPNLYELEFDADGREVSVKYKSAEK